MSDEAQVKRDPASPRGLLELKAEGRPIVAMTAYDVLFSRLLAQAGVDLILVGDSVGPAALGYDSTLPVTLDEMIHHARAVKRGAPGTLVVLDMPFLSYQVSAEDAVRNAGRAMKEAGVDAVKVEGGHPRTCQAVQAMVAAGIPVMGHLGPAPQSAHGLGWEGSQERSRSDAECVLAEARALEEAGVFALVLQRLPAPLAREVSASLTVPTVGIGAGDGCDGQVLLVYDALGLNPPPGPSFVKRFADLHGPALDGVKAFVSEVRDGTFPGPGHTP